MTIKNKTIKTGSNGQKERFAIIQDSEGTDLFYIDSVANIYDERLQPVSIKQEELVMKIYKGILKASKAYDESLAYC